MAMNLYDSPVARTVADRRAGEIQGDLMTGNFDSTLRKYQGQSIDASACGLTAVELFERAKGYLTLVRSCWAWGCKQNLIAVNPWADVVRRVAIPPRQRPRPFTADEMSIGLRWGHLFNSCDRDWRFWEADGLVFSLFKFYAAHIDHGAPLLGDCKIFCVRG